MKFWRLILYDFGWRGVPNQRWLKFVCATFGAGVIFSASGAQACSLSRAYLPVLAKLVAQKGYLIEARVVQGPDVQAERGEVLLASRILVGEGLPRRFIIARDSSFFDSQRTGLIDPCGINGPISAVTPRLFVLLPVEPDPRYPQEDRWDVPMEGVMLTDKLGIELALAEAARAGRFRGRIPSATGPGQ